jgi:hypothetical protein
MMTAIHALNEIAAITFARLGASSVAVVPNALR